MFGRKKTQAEIQQEQQIAKIKAKVAKSLHTFKVGEIVSIMDTSSMLNQNGLAKEGRTGKILRMQSSELGMQYEVQLHCTNNKAGYIGTPCSDEDAKILGRRVQVTKETEWFFSHQIFKKK